MNCPEMIANSLNKCGWISALVNNNRWFNPETKENIGWWDAVCVQMERNIRNRPQCDFLTCFAGGGLADRGICFLYGDPDNPECPMYKNEDKALDRWRKEYLFREN